MTESKAWNWKEAKNIEQWLTPSQECVYLAQEWKKKQVQSVLDLGCGLGRHALYFARAGYRVTAMDLSPEALASTETLLCENGFDTIPCIKGDMMSLPFLNGSFDAVFSFHVVTHQNTQGVYHVVQEITRVLKPRGQLFLTLCSKRHRAYTDPKNVRIDENSVMKTEGAEKDVPHFYADKPLIRDLFRDYEILSLREIAECELDSDREKCHYFLIAQKKD